MPNVGQIAARQNLAMNAGGNMVFMGGGISSGGSASLSAGGDLLLLAYDTGKQVRVIPRDKDNNPNNDKGPTWAYENSTYHQTGVDINVGGSFNASAGNNLVAQGTNAPVGGSTNLSAGGNYEERSAYDISERVSGRSIKMSGIGTPVVTPSSPTPAVRSSPSPP